MRCLSLHQPWASLMVTGLKRVETRGPHLAGLKPGPLLIHAAKKFDREQMLLCAREPFASALGLIGDSRPPGDTTPMPFGEVIGCVNVLAVVNTDRVHVKDDVDRLLAFDHRLNTVLLGRWEKAFGDYTENRIAVVTEFGAIDFAARSFPFHGRQGVFDVPDEMVAPLLADWKYTKPKGDP
jgi:hypothetical protein